jgi:secreted trypsin-like serine protease
MKRLSKLLAAISALAVAASAGAAMLEPTGKTVIGGEPVKIKAVPWQVSIQEVAISERRDAHRCGGSIYSATWIVTAAHCVDDVTAADILVGAGQSILDADMDRYKVKRIIIHSGYQPSDALGSPPRDDVALLELEVPVGFGKKREPIGLITAEEEALLRSGTKLSVSGWGKTKVTDTRPHPKLQRAEVPLVPRQVCNRPESYGGSVDEGMLCAGFAGGGVDSCQWDSGGPLVVAVRGEERLVGIVSWGHGCAGAAKYGVYARVAKFRDWLVENAV